MLVDVPRRGAPRRKTSSGASAEEQVPTPNCFSIMCILTFPEQRRVSALIPIHFAKHIYAGRVFWPNIVGAFKRSMLGSQQENHIGHL